MDSYAAEFEAQREDEVSRRHVASVAEEVAAIPGDQETSGFQGSPASGFRNAGF
jgi:hypothetical protein